MKLETQNEQTDTKYYRSRTPGAPGKGFLDSLLVKGKPTGEARRCQHHELVQKHPTNTQSVIEI